MQSLGGYSTDLPPLSTIGAFQVADQGDRLDVLGLCQPNPLRSLPPACRKRHVTSLTIFDQRFSQGGIASQAMRSRMQILQEGECARRAGEIPCGVGIHFNKFGAEEVIEERALPCSNLQLRE